MFGYKECVEAIVALEKAGATAGVVGKSLLFREIPFVKIGNGDKKIIITGAIHAREWITARLVIAQAEYALKNGAIASVWFLPTINPDGVEIALGRSKPPVWFNGNVGLWKANARGVDLNVNFPARWGTGESNTFTKGSQNYVGDRPLSEPETQSLVAFTKSVKPDATVSYHTAGREIYYDFFQEKDRLDRDRRVAEKINGKLGYKIVSGLKSAGGYKDWCVEWLKIPALTIEVGDSRISHPLSENDITEDIERNLDLPQNLAYAID